MPATPTTTPGTVYVVGAGPGATDLLTMRALECLQAADLVIHDKLVQRRILDLAPQAEQRNVRDYGGKHSERQQLIVQDLVAASRAGKTVVRLKGGDPWIFGRGAEETAALREAGVPYEIIPGITSGLAAAAFAGIPLTNRDHSSAVAFVTGHECSDKDPKLDWSLLARFPGALVIYMGLASLQLIVNRLRDAGMAPATLTAVVEWASLGNQRTVEGTLADIADRVSEACLSGPAIILIGPVVASRSRLAWKEHLPLFGTRVLLTRPRGQERELARRLETLGARVLYQPVLEIGPPPDHAAVRAAIRRLHEYDWLVFTSSNGVRALLTALFEQGEDLRVLGGRKLAAIGPHTAATLSGFHLRADVVPPNYQSESLAETLIPLVRDQKVLLARADRGRPVLEQEMRRVATVDQVAVYSQRDVTAADSEMMRELEDSAEGYVFVTSGNVARALAQLASAKARQNLGRQWQVVSISPVTSAVLAELGVPVAAEAQVYDGEGMIQALLQLVAQRSSRSVSMQT